MNRYKPSVRERLGEDELFELKRKQGLPVTGVDIRLIDGIGNDVSWDGVTQGEICVRGPWITDGYLGGEGAEKFTDDGWFDTGDVAVGSPDGYFVIADRVKDLIKSGGEWISSVELEGVLTGHPEIAAVTVIGIPDPRWDERPCAIVVPVEGAVLDPLALRAWLVGRVARWWIPEYWAFVDAIPLTSVGKVDKKVLRAQHETGEIPVAHLTTPLPQQADS